jgi:two-component system response regulator WspF
VIAQHVDSEFSAGLCSWLQRATPLPIVLATAGCRPAPGTVLLAGSNDHLVLTAQRTFIYSAEPRKLLYRPSVDVLFRSLAEHWPGPAVAVLLTGMGRDGAQGLEQLRQLGWHTIAEAESSCVVFGMPKAAIELGAAREILPLASIPAAIARACERKD